MERATSGTIAFWFLFATFFGGIIVAVQGKITPRNVAIPVAAASALTLTATALEGKK